jgi:Ca2+-binding EF-hand superfamily protein
MARELARLALVALTLVVVAAESEAQRGRGRGRGRAGAGAGRGAPASPGWTNPDTPQPGNLPPLEIPGVDVPGAGAKGAGKRGLLGAPAGTAPAARGPAKPVAPPLDPMTAADEVTAAADHLAAQRERELRQLREHFAVCDLDANGWLSLRELEVTLALSREEFRRTDANLDGGIELAEFEAQRERLLPLLGVPLAPADEAPAAEPAREPPAGPTPEPASTSAQAPPKALPARPHSPFSDLLVRAPDLLQRYDLDDSKGLSVAEVAKLLTELGLELSPEVVVAQMDPNDSGELGARELGPLAWLATKHMPEALRPDPSPPAPEVAAASTPAGEAPTVPADDGAPHALAPPARASHFDLLDPGRDGALDEADLRALQSQARLDVRLRAVLSAMDADGDGQLSRAEFDAAMGR